MTTYEPNQKRYEGAKFRRCGKSGLVLPAISLGFWQNFGGVNVFETCRAVVRRAFDRGVTHFDLANMYGPPYGSAEENLGAILKKDFGGRLRDELLISTKAGYEMWPGPYGIGASKKHVVASLDQSLRRLGVDYVDIFYAHRPWPEVPMEETMSALAPTREAREDPACGDFFLQPRANEARLRAFEERRCTHAHSSAVLLHAKPAHRKWPSGRTRGSGCRLHWLFGAGTGVVDQ